LYIETVMARVPCLERKSAGRQLIRLHDQLKRFAALPWPPPASYVSATAQYPDYIGAEKGPHEGDRDP
jgi:hypothetical protein